MVTGETADDSHDVVRREQAHWRPSRPVLVLVGARAVNQLGAFSLPFLAVLLVSDHGASAGTAGLVVALFGVATIPSRLAGGWLTARIGARATVALGLGACAVSQLAIAAAPSLGTTLLAVTALGLAYEIYEPGSQSLVADLTPAADRSRAFGLFGAALALGGVLGGLLATVLGGLDLRWLFVADATSCVAAAVVVRLGLPDHRPRAAADVAPGPGAEPRPWRNRRLVAMVALGTGFAVLYLQLRVALPLTLVDRGIPASRFGLVLTVASLTVVAAQPLLGRFTRCASGTATDSLAAMVLGFAVLAAGLAATGMATSLAGFVAATVVWALGDVLLLGHPFAVVAELAPAGGSAAYLAAYGCCWGVAGVVAPLVAGLVLDHGGPTVLWLGAAVAGLGLAATTAALRHRWTTAVE